MKLDKGKRKGFKSEEAYLGDIYTRNIDKLSVAYSNEKMFIRAVQARKVKYGTNVTGAIKKILNTDAFTAKEFRAAESVKAGLVKHGKWKQFQNMTRDWRGRYTAYDPNLLVYEGNNIYIYMGSIQIAFENSPKDITLTRI